MKRETNRGGFTLIELLVVTVVVVTLMGVVFRLAGVGGTNRARAKTIDRLQRLENALSGYYAAYGSYPPVPLQGRSRSIYKKVDAYGLQERGDKETGSTSMKSAKTLVQIEAACRAQPLSVSWPSSNDGELGSAIQELATGGESPYTGFRALSGVGSLNLDAIDWRAQGKNGKDIQLFEFGLLSFLFPRYFFMLDGKMSNFYDHKVNGRYHNQWAANNQLPCRLDTGAQFADWDEVRKAMGAQSSSANARWEAGLISNLTSQAVCARWMPNFQGIVSTIDQPRYRFFYGVDVMDENMRALSQAEPMDPPDGVTGGGGGDDNKLWKKRLRVFPGSGSGSSGSKHLLLSMTVRDGWGCEFYYYSDPPYQSYRLWSSGANRVTFPPWYDLDSFSGEDLNLIHSFISDDIVHLSN